MSLGAGTPQAAPLEGLRVLAFSTLLSGLYGSQILADLGADAIKVASSEGDVSQTIEPHFVAGESVYFHTINRNKRSITIDLKRSDAATILRDLIA